MALHENQASGCHSLNLVVYIGWTNFTLITILTSFCYFDIANLNKGSDSTGYNDILVLTCLVFKTISSLPVSCTSRMQGHCFQLFLS